MEKGRSISAGKVLKEEFLVPLELSGNALAQQMGVPANRINGIIAGSRRITASTAILLSKALGTPAEFWLDLQMHYELEEAQRKLDEKERAKR